MQASKAIPIYFKTIASQINKMFESFKPYIREEIHIAKSKIHVSFDSQRLKRKNFSVIRVVIHFINNKYKAVTRLISLPELLGHRKSGVSKLQFFLIQQVCSYTLFISSIVLINSEVYLLQRRKIVNLANQSALLKAQLTSILD